MTKKFFAAMLVAAVMMTGCGDDSAEINEAPAVAQASPVTSTVPTFTATTITGETVTNEIFAAKKITMVNIWGTFCPPCIGEMPDLGAMARSLPDNAQIIGIVCDASERSTEVHKAVEIVHQANADFVNIVPNEQLLKFIAGVEVVPTTVFVNSKGEVVGKTILGADLKSYKAEITRLLNQ